MLQIRLFSKKAVFLEQLQVEVNRWVEANPNIKVSNKEVTFRKNRDSEEEIYIVIWYDV